MLVALFTLLGLVLRIAMARRGGLWCDEAQFLGIVRMPNLRALIEFLCQHESHPPIFYMLMRCWLWVFGDSEPAALALPVLLGTTLIPVAYYVGNRVFSERTGLTAAVLIATAPLLAFYSGFVRPYSLLPLLSLASVYFLWRGLGGARPWIWIAQAMITLGMLLTHNWAWMVLGAEILIVGILLANGQLSVTTFRNWVLAQLAVALGYAAWVPILLHQARYAGHGPSRVDPLIAISLFLGSITSLPPFVLAVFLLPVIVAYARDLSGRASGANLGPVPKARYIAVFLFAGIPPVAYALATLLSHRNSLYQHEKCIIMLSPCILLLISLGISSWPRWGRLAGIILTTTYLLISLARLDLLKSNSFALAEAVSARSEPSDLVVVTPCWISSSFFEYYHASNLGLVYPYNYEKLAIQYDRIKDRLLDPGLMARFRAEIEQAYQAGRRVWLVTSNEFPGSKIVTIEGDGVPDEARELSYTDLAQSRANQITKLIESKFGRPVHEICPLNDRLSFELLRASLYRQGDTDPTTKVDAPAPRLTPYRVPSH